MSISGTAKWDVRTTGNDANGGFYTSGGTDYSQQDAAQWSANDATCDGATAVITSVTGGFTAAMVGNGINFGTSFFEVTSFTNGNTIGVDRVPAGPAVNPAKIGGAVANLGTALAAGVKGNIYNVKKGSYTVSANPTVNAASATPGNGGTNWIRGYNATQGDNPQGANRPTLTATVACTTVLPLSATQGWWVDNLIIDCGTTIANRGVDVASYSSVNNTLVKNFKVYGINLSAVNCAASNCEITAGTAAASAGIHCGNTQNSVTGCFIHDNACPGVVTSSGCTVTDNIIANNTGATSDGINDGLGCTIVNNVLYANGRDGIRSLSYTIADVCYNNILVNNAGYGINHVAATESLQSQSNRNNFYYNNTSGARNGFAAGLGDVTLTASPFTNTATNDYSLNATPGGGAAIKGVGFPGLYPGSGSTSAPDGGAVQSSAGGGGGGGGAGSPINMWIPIG